MQRRALLCSVAGAATTALAGCSAFAGGPREPTHTIGVTATTGPTLRDGIVYLTTGPENLDPGEAERSLVGVDLDTGERVVTVPGVVKSTHPPVVTDDGAFVCGWSCQRLSFESGSVWRLSLRDRFGTHVGSAGPPILRSERVSFGLETGEFVALDRADGSVQWTADEGSRPMESWDGNAWATVASTSDGSTAVLDPSDGSVRARRSFSVRVTPTVLDDGVLLGGSWSYFVDGDLQPRWRYPLGRPFAEPPVSVDGTVYLAGVTEGWDTGTLAAVDLADGTKQWRTEVSGGVYSSPAVADDGRLAVGTIRSEELVVLSPDGTIRDRWPLDGQVTGPVRTDGSRFVALTEEGSIYVVG